MPYFSGFYGKSGKIKIKIEKNVKKLLTDAGIDARISLASAVDVYKRQVCSFQGTYLTDLLSVIRNLKCFFSFI